MNKSIGQIIKEARKQKKLTQEELGNIVGVQKSAVAKWENGRISEIGRSKLIALSKALDLDPNVLLFTPEDKPTDAYDILSGLLAELRTGKEVVFRDKKLDDKTRAVLTHEIDNAISIMVLNLF